MNDFKLDNHKKSTGFKAPEGYFATLEERVLQQLPVQERKTISLYRKKPVWLGMAASFALLFGGGLYFSNYTGQAAQPTSGEIESYLVYNTNVTAYDLGQQLTETDLKELSGNLKISDESIENYLLDDDTTEY